MQKYSSLAKIYDDFTADKPNDEWAAYINDILRAENIKNGDNIVDICCGTGGITYELYKKGFRLTGLDSSSDMLEAAASRFLRSGAKIQLICQDIRDIKLHKKQNAIVCINDGINYIITINDIKKAFKSIYNALLADGVFLFDISSEYKLSSMHNQSYFEEKDKSAYIWHNTYDFNTRLLTMDISLYLQVEESLYEKSNEIHIQRAHLIDEMIDILNQIGFKKIKYYECFTLNKPADDTDRIQFTARK